MDVYAKLDNAVRMCRLLKVDWNDNIATVEHDGISRNVSLYKLVMNTSLHTSESFEVVSKKLADLPVPQI